MRRWTMWLCDWGIHRWAMWSKPYPYSWGHKQARRCERCGRVEMRDVWCYKPVLFGDKEARR